MKDKNASDNDEVVVSEGDIQKEIQKAISRNNRRVAIQPIVEREICDDDGAQWLIRRTNMPNRKDLRRFWSVNRKANKKKMRKNIRRKHYSEYGRDEEE